MQSAFFFDIEPGNEIYTPSRKYVLHWARNPNPGSNFDLLMKSVRGLPDDQLIGELESQGYDMLLGYEYPKILGHYAFQKHEDGLHVFSVATGKEYRKVALVLWDLTRSYLEGARKRASRTRLSGGNDERIKKLMKLLVRKQEKYGIIVDPDTCWIELYRE